MALYGGYLGKELDKAEAVLGEEGLPADEEELEEEDGFFIPFPGTTKPITQKPYRGTDPEWQQFLAISRDKKLITSLKGVYILFPV